NSTEYLSIIEKLRDVRPDIAFSSDIIVGFPGETDRSFENTLNLVEQVNYSQAYSFKYSRRPGTPGSIMQGQVSEDIKTERLLALQEILDIQQCEFNSAFIGKSIEVLIERRRRKDNLLVGKSPYMQAVHLLEDKYDIGNILRVNVFAADKNSLKAKSVQLLSKAAN
ncbi:MAG: TRAM domain-containing protein, partial [Pelagibacterales bacterium]|nr:TRAM domain-containing protein [Pelagibacterales bacterium]